MWGKVKEWDAEITEQRPDERVVWTATDGARNAGVVTFHKLGEGKSRGHATGAWGGEVDTDVAS